MIKAKDITSLIEVYFTRGEASTTMSRDPRDKTYEIFVNPTHADLKDLGKVIRFTAYNDRKKVYAWIFDKGHHLDTAKAVGVSYSYNDPDVFVGAAEWDINNYIFA